MKQCPVCRGNLKYERVTESYPYQGKVVILENVPAQVCTQCGESLLRSDVVKKIEHLTWSGGTPDRTTEVPVYDLGDLSLEP